MAKKHEDNAALPAAPEFNAPANVEERIDTVGQGSQNVTADDVAIPRIKLLQKINDEVDKSNSKYVEGAESGMFLNTVTQELSTALLAVNLHFDRKVKVWRKRKFGGGIWGTFDSEEQARAALQEAGEVDAQYDIVESPAHLLMLLDEKGTPKGVALLDMPSTKVKVSKLWNAQIIEKEREGHPRFGCVWKIGVVTEESPNGAYENAKIDFITVAPDDIYNAALSAYQSFFGTEQKAA
ncbi:hypothetical protein ACPV5S_15570 [Vibrio astriarenae]